MQTITVNGRIYAERKSPVRTETALASLLMHHKAISRGMLWRSGKSRSMVLKMPCDDLISEFGLVEMKKSTLSKMKRNVVIAQFFNKYELIAPSDEEE